MTPQEWEASQGQTTTPSPNQWEKSQVIATLSPQEWDKEQATEDEPFYKSGYLGRIATVVGESAAKLGMSKEEVEATEKVFPKPKEEPTPGLGESLSLFGKQLVEHPLDSLVELGKGLAADPELLFPGLWEAMPAKLAAIAEKAGTAAKVAGTGARAAAIGAAVETGAGVVEGQLDPQKVANTAVLFGIMGAGTKGAIEGSKGVLGAVKGKVLEDIPPPKEPDPSFQKSKIRPEETVSDVIARKNEDKKLVQAAFIDKTTGEIIPQGIKHSENLKADSSYTPGFLTQEGEFLNRKEGLTRAVETKQIPEDHYLDELHSTDLRDAGVLEFQRDLPRAEKEAVATKALDDANAAVHQDLVKEASDHPATMLAAANVVGEAMSQIQALSRKAKIWGKTITNLVPDSKIRDRVTRAMESEKSYDKIMTDVEKTSVVDGMSKALDSYPKKIAIAEKAGEAEKVLELKDKEAKLRIVRDKLAALPSEEHAIPVMKAIEARLKVIGDQAESQGLIDGLRTNYITHILDFSKTKMTEIEQQALLDRIFGAPKDSKLVKDFTVARKYEFLRELEKAVEGTGVVVHTDVAIIAEAYEKSMLTAIIHDKMINHFKELKAPNDKGFLVPISAEAIKEGYVAFQGKGAKPLEGLLVHPDLVDIMGFMFQQREPHLIVRALGAINHLTKSLNTIGSFFHAYSLATVTAIIDPAMFVKEVFSRGAGTRAAAKAFMTDENHELINSFLESGLMAGTEDIQRTIIADIGKGADNLLSKFAPPDKSVRAVQHLTEPFDKVVLQKINSFTWDYMHTGQKLNMAMSLFAKAKSKNPEIPDAQLQKEISRFINNSYGGLNWLDIANQVQNQYLKAFAMKAAGIRGREWGQIMLFAPDWTVSTLRSFTTALPKELSKPKNWQLREGIKGVYNPITQGDFARRYVLNTAIAYLTIQNGLNIAFSGHPIWENEDPTRVDNGDGTSTQVAKHSMETAEWVRDPMKTLGNKLGFWPKAAYVEISGHAYPSISAPKIKPLYEGYGGMELAKARAIALTASPFQVSAGVQAPEGKGVQRAIMSTLGIPSYGMTHEERKAAIKKGKLEAKKKRIEAKKDTHK